ncbi:putative addiction module antidote protein [Staphylococcus epidermidis]|nr:putative addiction module antidote protein [Staphylococcus epidermidis]
MKAFDAAEYLHSDEDCAAYLQACLEQEPDNAALFTKALGDIARARGMMQLAKDTGSPVKGSTSLLASKATQPVYRHESDARPWAADQYRPSVIGWISQPKRRFRAPFCCLR